MEILEKNVVIPISQLQNWEDNPRSIQKKDYERLKSQIKELGVYKPLLVSKNGKSYDVIAGNMRLRALKELGFGNIDCWIFGFKNKQEKIKLSLSDNDRVGYYDDQALAELVYPFKDEISLQDFKVDLRIPDIDPGNILDRFAPENEKDDEVPEVRKTKIKLGDSFQLGNHRLLCGDATKKEDIERLMDGKKANMVFTDPPYGIDVVGKDGKIGGGSVRKGKYYPSQKFKKVTNDDKPFDPATLFNLAPTARFSECELIWTNIGGRIKYYHFTWNGMTREGNRKDELVSRVHPTQKPVGLITKILSDYEYINVIDPYGGSGSTLIACEKLDRRCYMMEIEPIYCQVIINRWENYTGNKAEKVK